MNIKSIIDDNLRKIGYEFNTNLYRHVKRLSNNPPSYRIMADIILRNLEKYNPELSSKTIWNYTTYFVNHMKSNLIMNNKYFQKVIKNGVYDPIKKKYNSKVRLFDLEETTNNKYEFIKKFYIYNNNYYSYFDFVLLINNFPLILIKVVDNSESNCFEKEFSKLEIDFERTPMFFNFNKLIILINKKYSKIGTMYDFPEDYITLNNMKKDHTEINLYQVLKPENIINIIVENKSVEQMYKDINISFKKEKKHETDNINSSKIKPDDKYREENFKNVRDDSLNFEIDFFTQNLDEVLYSKRFKEKLKKAKEVPDFKENTLYIKEYRDTRDKKKLETLIEANEKLVIKEANKFQSYQTPSLDIEDIKQFGYMGLLKAVEKFDTTMDNKFSTYATYWIRQSIIRGINNTSLLIRVPIHQWEKLFKLKKLECESESKWGEVDYDWISKKLGKPKEAILSLLSIRNNFMVNASLYTHVGTEKDSYLYEVIPSDNHNVEASIMDLDLKEHLLEALSSLDKRSKDIIIKRFGLYGQKPMTLQEIASIYGLTRERIRQIEKSALEKLKNPKWAKKYKIYYGG